MPNDAILRRSRHQGAEKTATRYLRGGGRGVVVAAIVAVLAIIYLVPAVV